MTDPSSESAIAIRNVWKVSGEREIEALADIRRNGISKRQALERYNCVIGVAHVSLDVRRGEIFCVMGLSGSGKSTLVRHINRLLEPSAGEIHVNGRDVLALSPKELRQFRNEHIAIMVIVDDAKRRIGVVTRSHLLNAVIEGTETL